MLVLSRFKNERLMIGDDVVITIVDVRGDKVRLGIEAPNAVPVHREEIYQKIHEACTEAPVATDGGSFRGPGASG